MFEAGIRQGKGGDDIIVVTSSSMDRSGGVKRERETSLFSCQKVVWHLGGWGRSGAQSAEIIMRSALRNRRVLKGWGW